MNSDFTVPSELMMYLQSLQTIYRPVSDLGHRLNWLKSEFKRSVLCSLNVCFVCVISFSFVLHVPLLDNSDEPQLKHAKPVHLLSTAGEVLQPRMGPLH